MFLIVTITILKKSTEKQQTTAQTESSSENMHNVEKSNYQTTKRKTPNYSKVDNTINIENIYASQIVEEIRRERERKVLQKRRFKKALQQKRQQNQQSEEDSIQKLLMKCMLSKPNITQAKVHWI